MASKIRPNCSKTSDTILQSGYAKLASLLQVPDRANSPKAMANKPTGKRFNQDDDGGVVWA